jgi:tetratricopeptide (TPR) repeat protein
MFFEQAREAAEREFKANNKDAMALTKWGGALLELAHFRQGAEAYDMIEEAIHKFQSALRLDAGRHDALWCLGNAYTSQGFLSAEAAAANAYFTRAVDCFRTAVEQEPDNESYKRALEMSAKAPSLYLELQRQLREHSLGGSPREEAPARSAAQVSPRCDSCLLLALPLCCAAARPPPAPCRQPPPPRARVQASKAGVSEFWYDLGGWVTLVGLGFGIAALSRTK